MTLQSDSLHGGEQRMRSIWARVKKDEVAQAQLSVH